MEQMTSLQLQDEKRSYGNERKPAHHVAAKTIVTYVPRLDPVALQPHLP